MNTGTIKFFNAHKGFGFITADEGGKDIFLPGTAIGDVKAAHLSPGQRVEFQSIPDAKGPKVSQIRLLGKVVSVAPPTSPKVTVYCDPSSEVSEDVLDAIGEAELPVQVVDFLTTPMAQDQLKRLSLSLGEAGQSLVRRFDPLFLALQLDDRFIGESEFWTGIIEHPALLQGPVVVFSGRTRICRSAKEVQAFLAGGGESAPEKAKSLSPRLVALLRGEQMPAPAIAAKPDQARIVTETKPAPVPEAKKPVKKAAPEKPKAKKSPAPAKTVKSAAPAKKKAPAKPAAKAVKSAKRTKK